MPPMRNSSGTIVGSWFKEGEKVVYLTDRSPAHFMKKYQAFGIDRKIIDFLDRMAGDKECQVIILYHPKAKDDVRYTATLTTWMVDSLEAHYTTHIDHGNQLFLPVSKMRIEA